MKWIMSLALAGVLATSLPAEDKDKTKVKVETKDPITGEKIEHKSKVKTESDGDFKVKSRTKVDGDTVEKVRSKGEGDGDYKEKVETKGPDGKYKSKTKVDK